MTTSPRTWTDGEVLTAGRMNSEVRDTLRLFLDPPYVLLSHSADQVVTANTDTAVQWNTEARDNYGGHDTVTNNTRYTAQLAGVYLLVCHLPWIDPGVTYTGDYAAYFRLNGVTAFEGCYHNLNAATGNNFSTVITAVQPLALGDYIEVMVRTNQTSSGVQQGFHDGQRWEVQWLRNIPS